MLVFAALAAGCTHSSESHNADASVTAPAEQPAEAPEAPTGPQPATAAEAAQAMDEAERTGSAAPANAGGTIDTVAQVAPASEGQAPQADETACVDAWLKGKKLDRYGSPEGTMYAGGTPLFDERTGERAERLPFVYKRHPAAKKACQADGQPKQQAK